MAVWRSKPAQSEPMPIKAREQWSRLTEELDAAGAVPCRESDPEAWWPVAREVDEAPARMALAACSTCPVQQACLEYALAADERFGIWGGTLPAERKAGDRP